MIRPVVLGPRKRRFARAFWFPFGVILILVGGALITTGELLGVFDGERGDNNTISEWVWWLRRKTHGASTVVVLGLLGLLAYHFAVQG